MKTTRKIPIIMLIVALTLAFALPLPASAEMVKKVDNFILLIDQSGSMAQRYGKLNQKKINLAVDAVTRLDRAIPDLGYTGSMVMSSPYEVSRQPGPYLSGTLAAAANGINTDFDVFGRNTTLGDDLSALGPILADRSGKTALVLLTDADNNAGLDPVAQARALYSRYGSNLCIHVISFADEEDGRTVIDQIRGMSDCSVVADADALASEAAMNQFAKDVFYRETPAPARAAAPAPPGDRDGDGVTDDRDQCPNTPKGEFVDEVGCTLKMTLHINFDFDKAEIKPAFKPELDKAANFIQKYNQVPFILLAGHTDNIGEEKYNQQLSLRRAEAVRQYLIDNHGIRAKRLVARGYGESQPVANNGDEAGRYENRRTEVICCILMPE